MATHSPGEIEAAAVSFFRQQPNRKSTRSQLRFGSNNGSIVVELSGEKAGCWYDHSTEQGGYLFRGEECPEWKPRERRPLIEHDPERERVVQQVLGRALPVDGTPAERYLNRRGIVRWPGHSIKYCTNPCGLLALSRIPDGKILACQIVYLNDDGTKNRNVDTPKRTYSIGRGWHELSAVRLPGRGEPIMCEGPETGLSIWQATGRTVLACLGMAGFKRLRIGRKSITIARDGDAPDSDASRHLARWIDERKSAGIRVKLATPPEGQDFNDIMMNSGEVEVARLIKGAETCR